MEKYDWRKPEGKEAAIREAWGGHVPPLLEFLVEDVEHDEGALSSDEVALTPSERKLAENAFFRGEPGEISIDSPMFGSPPRSLIITVENAKSLELDFFFRGKSCPLITAGPAPLGDPRFIHFGYLWSREEWVDYQKKQSEENRRRLAKVSAMLEENRRDPKWQTLPYRILMGLYTLTEYSGPFSGLVGAITGRYHIWLSSRNRSDQ